jgi:hypothetical protein
VGESLLELGDLCLEPGDLGFPRVGDLSGLLRGPQAAFEVGAEVGIGAGAVERGAVASGLAGEGLDVALAAARDLASQEPVHGGPDAVLVLGPLGCGDPHAGSLSGVVVLAASFSVRTRIARSYSLCRRLRSVLRVVPSWPRKVFVRSACSLQMGR